MQNYTKFVVKVGGGSGLLFKIHCADYMYILTAKHVVVNPGVTVSRQTLDETLSVVGTAMEIIGGPYLHADEKKDAALLKVAYDPTLDSIARIDNPLTVAKAVQLAGFPGKRSKKDYGYRSDLLAVKNVKEHGYFEGQLDRPVAYHEIAGLSGGGIFHSSNSQHYLMGIQSRMSADDDDEMLSNIDFMPLSFFDEIIAQNPGLAALTPEHLFCFSTLKSYAMKLEGCLVEHSMEFTREYLREITGKIVASNLTPTLIRDFFQKRLLVYANSENVLNDKGLWVAWLEFLIILNIIREEQIDEGNIRQVFGDYDE